MRIAGGARGASPLPVPFSAPSWSPDGGLLVFAGFTDGGGRNQDPQLFAVPAEGGTPHPVPGTMGGLYPIFSPYGQIAFIKVKGSNRTSVGPGGKQHRTYAYTSIWVVGLDGSGPRRLTPWQKQLSEWPTSFTPDGSELMVSISREHPFLRRVIALPLDGGERRLIADRALDAVYSPDGTRIALLTVARPRTVETPQGTATFTPTELAVAASDGSGLSELTHTPALELQPSWDPSGLRLAYTQLSAIGGERSILGFGDSIMEINADGSCRTRILSYRRAALFGPLWQPGPGREAGPISC